MRLWTSAGAGLAALLVVAGVVCAQEVADPPGIMIRVDRPAANAWAGIGDRIEIRVLTYVGTLHGGFRVSVVDVTVRDRDVGVRAGGAAAPRGFVYYNIYIPGPGNLPQGVAFGDGAASGVDTFRVSITATPRAAAFASKNSRAVKVVVDLDADTEGNELNNLMTKAKITPASTGFGANRVGDGVRFGIDANRPDHASVFRSFSVDTDGLNVDTTRAGLIERVRFGIGDRITIRLGLNTAGVLDAGADRIRAGVVEADSAFSSAPVSFELAGDRLYRANPRASAEVGAGDFGDNRRVRVEAYLADAAGNLGGASMDAAAPSPVSAGYGLPDVFDPGGVEWIADATPSRITVVYPRPDRMENRISAAVTQTLQGYRRLPGEAEGVQAGRRLNPLAFTLSEVPDSIRITHGDSAHGIGGRAIEDVTARTAGNDVAATFALPWKYAKAGGVRKDLTVEVWDSVGNRTSLDLEGIWYDEQAPVIGSLFPTAAAAPRDPDNNNEPTVNLASKDPVFTIDEELDSLSVRYIESSGDALAVVQRFGRGNSRLKTVGSLVHWPVDDAGFFEGNRYDLQVLAVDLAGNASVTDGGALTFAGGFLNPNADVIGIADVPDQGGRVVAGVDFTMRLSVLDTVLSRIEGTPVRALTYHAPVALAVIVSGDQAGALAGVSFGGVGVTPSPSFALPAEMAAAGMVARAAILEGGGWRAGRRDVSFRSARPLANAAVMAVEGLTDPVDGTWSIRTGGRLDAAVNVEAAEFSRFVVSAGDGAHPDSIVSGAFAVRVLPADAFGNASMKIDNSVESETYASVAVAFASSHAAVTVPGGVQTVPPGGAGFGAVAAELHGSAVITVRTVDEGLVTGSGDDGVTGALTGSATVRFSPENGTPDPPASITVEDYEGADGTGDQGGVVLIGFPHAARRDVVIHYRIEREVETTLAGYDERGREIHRDAPVKTWMHWATVGGGTGGPDGGVLRAVVPALDNVATRWGVRSVAGVDATAAGRRGLAKARARRILALPGIPAPVLTEEEPADRFSAPADVAATLIGDREDLVFAPLDPGMPAPAAAAVPSNIGADRAAGELRVSARTETDGPVAAVDNVPPAAVTGASGDGAGGVALRWTASADDGVVGFIPYRGYNVPIPGVKGYRVMRGASAGGLEEIALLPAGTTRFVDDTLPGGVASLVYRIDAVDDNNATAGDLIAIGNVSVRAKFADAAGDPVYLIVLPSQGGDLQVNLEDLIAFAAAFGARMGDPAYTPQADVNDDRAVNFADFVAFAASFGRTAMPPLP